jgi:hypothetical protein
VVKVLQRLPLLMAAPGTLKGGSSYLNASFISSSNRFPYFAQLGAELT